MRSSGLVNAIGGVDYDCDITFYMHDRYYEKGLHVHMDGQGVLDYLRVRKRKTSKTPGIVEGKPSADSARVNRQKNDAEGDIY